MRFYSQNDLLNYWEGGKTYKREEDGQEISVVSDPSRTIPYLTQKYFEVKAHYDAGKSAPVTHGCMKSETDVGVVADARYKIFYKGGRSEDRQGVFLYAFIEDCYALWTNPLTS